VRWQLEVNFQEARTHLGVDTQRQWPDLAIARTTPILLGLFSGTALAPTPCKSITPPPSAPLAVTLNRRQLLVDAIALARRRLWLSSEGFSLSAAGTNTQELPASPFHRMVVSVA